MSSSKMGLAGTTMKQCQKASINAYSQMRARGESDRVAFRASVSLYRCHHPEVEAEVAVQTVAEWIDEALEA